LMRAMATGVHVARSTRCAQGVIVESPASARGAALPAAAAGSPWQARIDLMLELMRKG